MMMSSIDHTFVKGPVTRKKKDTQEKVCVISLLGTEEDLEDGEEERKESNSSAQQRQRRQFDTSATSAVAALSHTCPYTYYLSGSICGL